MSGEIRLADLVVDCADEQALCAFYADLLGWEKMSCSAIPRLSVKTA